jgi:hypothetical protein
MRSSPVDRRAIRVQLTPATNGISGRLPDTSRRWSAATEAWTAQIPKLTVRSSLTPARLWQDRNVEAEADIDGLLARYRRTLLAMHEGRIETGGTAKHWNRLVDQLQSLHLALREHAAGRAGISALIDDDVATMRQWAASHALFWDEQRARAELEREAATDDTLWGFEAKITLREFDAGRLNPDWTPKGAVRPDQGDSLARLPRPDDHPAQLD